MNKKALIFAFMAVTILHAETVNSELGINLGMTSTKNDDGSKFDNPTLGITYKDNTYDIKPRVDLEYIKLKNEEAKSLLKGSFNGVYELKNSTNIIPYIVGGIGYEYVSEAVEDVFESHSFVHGGMGLKIDYFKEYKINLEGKYLQILGGDNEENELILTLGVTIPLGHNEPTKEKLESTYQVGGK